MTLEKKFQPANMRGEGNRISGYASLFGVRDQQGDIVQKGAFQKSIADKNITDIKMLWQHDPLKPIGVWHKIYEDEIGLFVEGEILQTIEMGREAFELLQAGAVTGLSIGYRTLNSGKSNGSERILKSVDLWEISLVTFPMLKEASAQLTQSMPERAKSRALLRACRELSETMKYDY